MNPTLSKSDFTVALFCAKKLEYKKKKYPNSGEANDFLASLAEGGFIVGKMATLLYPGIAIVGNTTEALAQTKTLLEENDTITLHEAAIQAGQKIIRIDILKKAGNVFDLIEVKAKSTDSNYATESDDADLNPYIEDALFQTLVLKEAFPKATINPFLLLPDKSKQTSIEGLASWFKIDLVNNDGNFNHVKVSFIEEEGTAAYKKKQQQLIADNLMVLVPLHKNLKLFGSDIKADMDYFLEIINSNFTYQKNDYAISKKCKGCEYNVGKDITPNGFKECWGKLADVQPSIFDLYYFGAKLTPQKTYVIDEMIAKKTVSLFDITEQHLQNKKGEITSRGIRQLMQIQQTKKNEEWVSVDLFDELDKHQYPLHFIDFETYTGAIPYHKGMQPYEVIAFQWSCHTINKPGHIPIHTEWINTEKSFPNFRFANALKKQIGTTGTVLMWATHENTVLTQIKNQMVKYNEIDEALETWLEGIIKKGSTTGGRKLTDMNKLTADYYFHPYMKGRTSIKKVLPAVWNYNSYLHSIPLFAAYFKKDKEGNIESPYSTLKYIIGEDSSFSELLNIENNSTADDVVSDGGAAMKAYNDMMYGDSQNSTKLKNQLLEYCKLDTLAMVIIYTHWQHLKDKHI